MAVTPGTTQHRSVKVSDADWGELGEATATIGGRGPVIRRLIRLYLDDPVTRRKAARKADPVGDRY